MLYHFTAEIDFRRKILTSTVARRTERVDPRTTDVDNKIISMFYYQPVVKGIMGIQFLNTAILCYLSFTNPRTQLKLWVAVTLSE